MQCEQQGDRYLIAFSATTERPVRVLAAGGPWGDGLLRRRRRATGASSSPARTRASGTGRFDPGPASRRGRGGYPRWVHVLPRSRWWDTTYTAASSAPPRRLDLSVRQHPDDGRRVGGDGDGDGGGPGRSDGDAERRRHRGRREWVPGRLRLRREPLRLEDRSWGCRHIRWPPARYKRGRGAWIGGPGIRIFADFLEASCEDGSGPAGRLCVRVVVYGPHPCSGTEGAPNVGGAPRQRWVRGLAAVAVAWAAACGDGDRRVAGPNTAPNRPAPSGRRDPGANRPRRRGGERGCVFLLPRPGRRRALVHGGFLELRESLAPRRRAVPSWSPHS